MQAFFPVVGEKEYKDSTLRTEQRQCVFTKLRVESVFISFVSFSFNKRHVSVPTRTSIRAIGAIRVKKNIRVIRLITSLRSVGLRRISCSKSRVPHVSAPPRTKIRESEIRMPNKNIRVIRVIRVQKIQYEIRVPHKYIRGIPKAHWISSGDSLT